jgi:hypothetical protein
MKGMNMGMGTTKIPKSSVAKPIKPTKKPKRF